MVGYVGLVSPSEGPLSCKWLVMLVWCLPSEGPLYCKWLVMLWINFWLWLDLLWVCVDLTSTHFNTWWVSSITGGPRHGSTHVDVIIVVRLGVVDQVVPLLGVGERSEVKGHAELFIYDLTVVPDDLVLEAHGGRLPLKLIATTIGRLPDQ